MASTIASLDDLLPRGWTLPEDDQFVSCAHYHEPMDCIVYLREDVAYRADRVDEFLTILWHPYDDRTVGVKLKGFRRLFYFVQELASASGRPLPETAFQPLVKAVEVAMTMQLAAQLMDEAERKRLESKETLTEQYARAFQVVEGVTYDPNQLRRASR